MNETDNLLGQFLAHIGVERGLAKSTVSAYEADVKKYLGWLSSRGSTT